MTAVFQRRGGRRGGPRPRARRSPTPTSSAAAQIYNLGRGYGTRGQGARRRSRLEEDDCGRSRQGGSWRRSRVWARTGNHVNGGSGGTTGVWTPSLGPYRISIDKS